MVLKKTFKVFVILSNSDSTFQILTRTLVAISSRVSTKKPLKIAKAIGVRVWLL